MKWFFASLLPPDAMQHAGYTDYHGMCLEQVVVASPLVNYALESGISIGNDDLAYVANHLMNGMPAVPSDASCTHSVTCIADVIFEHGEARTKFIEAAGANQSSYFAIFSKLNHRNEF